MLMLAVYPRQFQHHSAVSEIAYLREFLNEHFEPSVGIHLLPIWPSEGDDGFAVSSWRDIDENLGSAADVSALSNDRFVFLDGIFNHVGWQHPVAQKFLANPDQHSDLVHAIKSRRAPEGPLAKRGGHVFRPHTINQESWYIWQTYGAQAIDVNLAHEHVLAEVKHTLGFLKSLGVRGVRLDALAYYGKNTNNQSVHNADGIEKAENIVSMVRQHNLLPMLQVDRDSSLEHYTSLEAYNPLVIDYSFSPHLIFALLTGRTSDLVQHLRKTARQPSMQVVRPLRTHDGILMRSGNQTQSFSKKITSLFNKNGFQLRFAQGQLYESNHSLPHLLSIKTAEQFYYRKIMIGLIIATLTAEHSYIYLNSLLGDHPETDRDFGNDPRALQRRSISTLQLDTMPWSDAQMARIALNTLSQWRHHSIAGRCSVEYRVDSSRGVLKIVCASMGKRAVLNFSAQAQPLLHHNPPLLSDGLHQQMLEPYGYAVFNH